MNGERLQEQELISAPNWPGIIPLPEPPPEADPMLVAEQYEQFLRTNQLIPQEP